MIDMTPMPDDGLMPSPEMPPAGGPQGFFANPRNKIIVIAAVLGLILVVGAVVGIVLMNLGEKAVEQATVNSLNASLNAAARPAVSATGSVETTTEGTRVSVPVTNRDVFISRDPFDPVLEALPAVVTSSTPTTPSPDALNVLVLENVVTNAGTLKANVTWNGVLYPGLEAGKQVGASPWQILSLTKTTATMLYGDVQVTLSIGEGVAKD